MSYQSSIKHSSQSSLNSVPFQKLVITLDDKNEESLSGGALSGGAKGKFERYKPHINAGNFDEPIILIWV
ncbi:MAG: hypothetical protein HC903_05300 [Methylacidiphilales bacterium]|nr:hypothetical protein [Candidatus Methylacidiphilales bacterium]NJR14829.1 hypothetical protein [Calothrix sp. CSU_2_0]